MFKFKPDVNTVYFSGCCFFLKKLPYILLNSIYDYERYDCQIFHNLSCFYFVCFIG